MTPVLESRVRPSGRFPLETFHVMGLFPYAESAAEYLEFCIAEGRLVVWMTGAVLLPELVVKALIVAFLSVAAVQLVPFDEKKLPDSHVKLSEKPITLDSMGIMLCPVYFTITEKY